MARRKETPQAASGDARGSEWASSLAEIFYRIEGRQPSGDLTDLETTIDGQRAVNVAAIFHARLHR